MTESTKSYWFYKSKGICVNCCSEKAAKGRAKCLNCLDDDSVRKMLERSKWTPEKRETVNRSRSVRSKKQWQERKESGLCPRCGKRKPESGYVQCKYCRFKVAKQAEKLRRKRGALPKDLMCDGYHCVCCGGEVYKTKVCESCKKSLLKNLEKANETNRDSANNNSWHNTNKNFFGKKYFGCLKGE